MKVLDEKRAMVKRILLEDRASRNSDKELYIKVLKEKAPEILNQPLIKALRNEDLPSYESITRTRRWVQEHFEGTQADDKIEAFRMLKEEAYREEYGNARA